MLPHQWGAIEHRQGVTRLVFKPAQKAVEKLGLAVSDAPNALYGMPDITSCMIRMSGMESYAGVASDAAREIEAERMGDGAEGKRIPTPQWMLGKLREVPNEDAEARCMDMLRCSVKRARTVGMLRGAVTIAFDTTLTEYYGKEVEDYNLFVRSRSKNGTNDFLGHLAVQGIGPDSKVFLGARHLKPGASVSDLIDQLIDDIRRLGIKVVLALLDRGFYSVAVLKELSRRRILFLMPAVKRGPIKEIIREHAAAVEAGGDPEAVVDYTVRSKDDEFTHRLVILPRKGYGGSDPVEAYVVFATNMDKRTALMRIAKLSAEYKERWEIETGFRCVKATTGKTRSRSVPVRLILVYFAMLLYNFWIIVKFTESDGGDPALWARCIKEAEFIRALLVLIRSSLCSDTRRLPAAEPGKGKG